MHKNLIVFLIIFFVSPFAVAQDMAETEVPAAVVSTYKTKFPQAAEAKWKKNKSGKYEVDFKLSGKKAEAKFLSDGSWDSSQKRIETSALPALVSEYLKKNYGSHKVDHVTFKEENTASKNTYEVKLKKDKAETELTFDADGKFLKKKEKQDKSKKTT
ncbi:hypothetical protein GXP67_15025 [Rhodocytophaga rosea]|uniref:Putative beta-lactamase-inhibitor-like PepSY-like domain-containing protein n=1 Tax=Rhodocytophaga rosea TaxID=2704465 RepID=A0A6C0GIM6_9BACT|nr:PepSY-like domain-containing protein [Rhodocytophaga rosea]QHT67858.1 hypothetical protein GXP67_15025 [Rhodocytophaga rosea]